MLNVAIIEDTPEDLAALEAHLARFMDERGEKDALRVSPYVSAEAFLASYQPGFDVILLDIELPGANGMTAARALRVVDPRAVIIFVTNIASFAVSGYEVDALAYLLKPISYPALSLAMDKALRAVSSRQARPYLIQTTDQTVRVPVSAILYVEVRRHQVIFRTTQGTYQRRGSMREVEGSLAGMHFKRCHNAFLVNLEQVSSVGATEVVVGSDTLPLSRHRRQEFLDALTLCVGM